MSLHADYQKLEPGDEIRLFEIDGSAFNMGDILYFHGYNIPHTEAEILAAGGDESKLPAKSIWWQGTEYKAWPCELEGIESSTSGSDAQPTLRVGNINGSISALCLYYDDWHRLALLSVRRKNNILTHETFRKKTQPQIRRRKNGICILLILKALKPTNWSSLRFPVRWICRGF